MKKIIKLLSIGTIALFISCNNKTSNETTTTTTESVAGQSAVKDDESMKDVVKVAAGSAAHTTLVAAVKQAELVDVLSNAGPFTVFAPTNAAFDKLPAGTVDGLMKPEKKTDLQNILQYHVTTSALKADYFKDGMIIGMVNGGSLTVSVKDGKVILNNSATIVASIQASNGMVHVIDGVLLPK
jgi:uncharacterized surface protein with fasciclin (FAS1) repeats